LPELMEIWPPRHRRPGECPRRPGGRASRRVHSRFRGRPFGQEAVSPRCQSCAQKAQNQCRVALRLLLKLRAAEQSQKKSRNRTNKLMKAEIVLYDQRLTKASAGPDL